jgi:urease accessory protein
MLELITKAPGDGGTDDTVTLPYALRQKSRQRVTLDGGREAAIVLAPGTQVDDGDRLASADGFSVRVCAALEAVSNARTDDALRLARACYHLGNRHVALQVGSGWVRYLPDHVLDDMVRGLGLTVTEESARFEPERGAYAARPHAHPPDTDDGNTRSPTPLHTHERRH